MKMEPCWSAATQVIEEEETSIVVGDTHHSLEYHEVEWCQYLTNLPGMAQVSVRVQLVCVPLRSREPRLCIGSSGSSNRWYIMSVLQRLADALTIESLLPAKTA